ncbi:hypothetical protein VNO80_02621 [Phaseolus coccineus]|uniref:Uncharacterized protein n=1 Tax=Phaseolus coccineus TaxID=3886 RepID=A0AAN9NRT1_PHACN
MQRWRSRLGSISISRKGATTSSLDDHLSPPLSAIVECAGRAQRERQHKIVESEEWRKNGIGESIMQ